MVDAVCMVCLDDSVAEYQKLLAAGRDDGVAVTSLDADAASLELRQQHCLVLLHRQTLAAQHPALSFAILEMSAAAIMVLVVQMRLQWQAVCVTSNN